MIVGVPPVFLCFVTSEKMTQITEKVDYQKTGWVDRIKL